jgi:hypothetical protein
MKRRTGGGRSGQKPDKLQPEKVTRGALRAGTRSLTGAENQSGITSASQQKRPLTAVIWPVAVAMYSHSCLWRPTSARGCSSRAVLEETSRQRNEKG